MNPEFVYLLGMITGKGTIIRGNRETEVRIEIPHKNLIIQGMDAQLSVKARITDIRNILEPLINTRIEVNSFKNITILSFVKDSRDFLIREINRYLGNLMSCKDFRIPNDIFNSPVDIKKEFLRGIADVTGYVRNSNRDQVGRHRVYIEISNRNWYLPPQICQLQQSLNVPTQYIGYGHPNIRGGTGTSWAKEHQIKIYADDFEKIGFYISHKNEALKELADFNKSNFDHRQKLCNGTIPKSVREKKNHPHENHEKIPKEIRGKHFDSFREICGCLGCYKQRGKNV